MKRNISKYLIITAITAVSGVAAYGQNGTYTGLPSMNPSYATICNNNGTRAPICDELDAHYNESIALNSTLQNTTAALNNATATNGLNGALLQQVRNDEVKQFNADNKVFVFVDTTAVKGANLTVNAAAPANSEKLGLVAVADLTAKAGNLEFIGQYTFDANTGDLKPVGNLSSNPKFNAFTFPADLNVNNPAITVPTCFQAGAYVGAQPVVKDCELTLKFDVRNAGQAIVDSAEKANVVVISLTNVKAVQPVQQNANNGTANAQPAPKVVVSVKEFLGLNGYKFELSAKDVKADEQVIGSVKCNNVSMEITFITKDTSKPNQDAYKMIVVGNLSGGVASAFELNVETENGLTEIKDAKALSAQECAKNDKCWPFFNKHSR